MNNLELIASRLSLRRMFQRVPSLILYRPVLVNLFVLLMTLVLAWPIPSLKFETTVYDLVIEDLPETGRYETFKAVFGSDEIIRVVVKSKNILEPATFKVLEDLSRAAGEIKGVRRVISLTEIKKLVDIDQKSALDEFAAILEPVTLFKRNLISEDNATAAITLVLDKEVAHAQVLADIRKMISTAPDTVQLYQIGMPLVSEALAHFSKADFMRIPPVTIVIIALLLALLMRRTIFVVVPLTTVILAQIWTFGLMAWLDVPLSMLTMIVPVFFMAVGTAYCLHICTDYLKVSQSVENSLQAVSESFSKMAFPTVLAVATTVVGLASLLINHIEAIREFAYFACFGMISLGVIVLTFFPATLVLLPLPKGRQDTRQKLIERVLERIVYLITHHQKICLTTILTFGLICAVGIFRVKVETNPIGYFKPDVPIARHFHDIYQDLSGSFPVNVAMHGGTEYFFEELDNVRQMERLQEFIETLPGVDKTVSFVDYLKLVNYVRNRFDPKFYVLPTEAFELRMLINNFKIILGDDVFQRFMEPGYSRANILLFTHLSSSTDFLNTRDTILAHVQEAFKRTFTCEVTGLGMVISASSHLLTAGQVKSISLALVIIFIIMASLFLSMKVGLIAVLPTLFPIVVNFGLMGWFNIHLSVATSLIASIAIGLAVDDAIHYLVRYHSEFKKDLDKHRAIKDTIMHVGQPIIFTTLTISLGFSILMFSHFQPTALFGMMMVITMFSALVGDLFLLPVLIQRVELVTAWDLIKLIPTLGAMPPGLVHELNQPLNAIKVGSQFLKRMVKKNTPIQMEQLRLVADQISSQVDRTSAIINRLEEFSPSLERITEKVNLNLPVKGAESIIRSQLQLEGIELKLELADHLPPTVADHNRLVQVLFNVLTNAAEAIAEKGAASGDNIKRQIVLRTFQKKNKVVFTVVDTGAGMPAHIRDRIFQPFFTTKSLGKGIGLAISNEIVKDFDGSIDVESRPGEGTTVTISFPVAKS